MKAKSELQTRLDNVFGSCDAEESLSSAHLDSITDFLQREEKREQAVVDSFLASTERPRIDCDV